ncbi:hypothetical protein [Vibrio sp. 10N.261.46.A3]|uniref:hypothetical protein n=1 Tax=Vibrio sp. 10N.261.46.A3 TaxID=3229658 RepID=UPI00354DD866
MKTKVVQIKLRDNVPIENELMKHLELLGSRSGEPKRLILKGFLADVPEGSFTDNHEKGEGSETISSFASLAVKG